MIRRLMWRTYYSSSARSMVRTSTIYRLRYLLVVFQMVCEVSQRYVGIDSDVKKIDR